MVGIIASNNFIVLGDIKFYEQSLLEEIKVSKMQILDNPNYDIQVFM